MFSGMRYLICCLILTAVVVIAQYGLHQLAHSVELATFLEFCIAAVAAEVAIAFAWSYTASPETKRFLACDTKMIDAKSKYISCVDDAVIYLVPNSLDSSDV